MAACSTCTTHTSDVDCWCFDTVSCCFGANRLHVRKGSHPTRILIEQAPKVFSRGEIWLNVRWPWKNRPVEPKSRIFWWYLSYVISSMMTYVADVLSSMPWHCWFGGKRSIWPEENWVMVCWQLWSDWCLVRVSELQLSPPRLSPGNGPLNPCVCTCLYVGSVVLCFSQAEACRSVEQAFRRCPNGMYAEIKYDGERVQLHKKGKTFKYFSRSLKPVQQHKVQ